MKFLLAVPAFLLVAFLSSCNYSAKNSAAKTGPLMDGLASSNDSVRYTSQLLLLDSLRNGSYTWADIKGLKASMNKETVELLVRAEKFQVKGNDHKWIWSNTDYLILRDRLGVLLDILGHLYDRESLAICRRALELEDNSLKLFAAVSLLRQDQYVAEDQLEKIAADDETRLWLYKSLLEFKEISMFPEKYRTQDLLAQSEMVQWLIYPTELGSVPDEIKLEKKVRTESEGKLMDFYLFKFRSSDTIWKESGWMAGVAGGFLVNEELTPHAQGTTFSAFETWQSKSPEEHLRSTIGLLDEAKVKWGVKDSLQLSKTPL